MYAISEKGVNCPLVSELGFRDKNGNWNELAKALPGVTVSLKNDYKTFTVDGLTFEDVKRLDSSQMWTEDCDQYLWLDWRVHAKFSVDIEKYRRFSSDSGVTGRLYFSDSLCESTEPLAWWLVLLIVVLVLLLICIIGLASCAAKPMAGAAGTLKCKGNVHARGSWLQGPAYLTLNATSSNRIATLHSRLDLEHRMCHYPNLSNGKKTSMTLSSPLRQPMTSSASTEIYCKTIVTTNTRVSQIATG
eukprot:CAMPEP_0185622964 /NCGR_PEP_ID=MMETSP0436-20130131/59553_1 /TAXON_ID=626734 ORGANISM="Favella taraikaensis, Strain Fe Narragansett Bay" /NCGR_SAMPLE_ID=MMETSP0436 /ASSEMBLY_ACC=CAM_ASM_000390 /LENGTH=245 /DNA_ID=CAMNT_0028264837 /DNA_START=1086 /DNA_END=1824 /DNA_ORIENTATION=-